MRRSCRKSAALPLTGISDVAAFFDETALLLIKPLKFRQCLR